MSLGTRAARGHEVLVAQAGTIQRREGYTNRGKGRASGERRAAVDSGRSRTWSRRRTDGIRRGRGVSGGRRSEAAGIWRLDWEAYSASVPCMKTAGRAGSVGDTGAFRAARPLCRGAKWAWGSAKGIMLHGINTDGACSIGRVAPGRRPPRHLSPAEERRVASPTAASRRSLDRGRGPTAGC